VNLFLRQKMFEQGTSVSVRVRHTRPRGSVEVKGAPGSRAVERQDY
jgi:hypothetical protein